MAIRCDDCRYFFSKKRVSCPFCGGQTIRDDRPDADLLAVGYTLAPQGRQQKAPADPFEAMFHAYLEEQQQTQPIPTPPPAAEPPQPEQPQGGVDFFSQFQGSNAPGTDIPTVESTRHAPPQQEPNRRQSPRQQPFRQQPDPYEAELRELERQQRRLDRQYRRAAFWDRLSSLRWGTVFRVVVFVLVVLAAIGLWNMRYTILNSVLNLVIGFLPVILIVWGIWMLIRSLFL